MEQFKSALGRCAARTAILVRDVPYGTFQLVFFEFFKDVDGSHTGVISAPAGDRDPKMSGLNMLKPSPVGLIRTMRFWEP